MAVQYETDVLQRNVGLIEAKDINRYIEQPTEELYSALDNFDFILGGYQAARATARGQSYELTAEYSDLDVVRALLIPLKSRSSRPDYAAGHAICYVSTPEGLILGHTQLYGGRHYGKRPVELEPEPLSPVDRKHFSLVASIISSQKRAYSRDTQAS